MVELVDRLRGHWSLEPTVTGSTDYLLLDAVESCFAARSRAGAPALVVPLEPTPAGAVGRRAAGLELFAHPSIRFAHGGREWDGPAAAVVCTDPHLVEAFAVLAADVANRLRDRATWSAVVALVAEWQTLLAPRGKPTVEAELGLWGELWFLDRSADIDRALASWRGPEGDSTDFFVSGKSAEVKASRAQRTHYVSQSQVGEPVGVHDGWLVSLWVKADPSTGSTVPMLYDRIRERASDESDAVARMGRANYSDGDRRHYTTGFVLMNEPEWYGASSVPQVRAADPGVSQLRYRVTLDEARCADGPTASALWRHFHGREYGGTR